MEIKTQYNIGDVVKLQDSQTKFKVVGITACVKPDNDIIISYHLEHLVGKYVVGFNLENQLELPTETVDKTQCTIEVTIDIKEVYGVDSVEIPKGYKFKAFKPPKIGEIFLDRFTVTPDTCTENFDKDRPRIILEKI